MRVHPSKSALAWCAVVLVAAGTAFSAGQPPAPGSASRREASASGARPIRVLLLGHEQERPHSSAAVYSPLAAPLARRGIQLTHVATPEAAFLPERLHEYDALMIYGNHQALTPAQEQTLLAFVEGGKGLVAVHSASDMFRSSERYISMVGGQFLKHGEGEFTAEIVAPAHPVMDGLQPFSTWDETYVHTKHNAVDRTVLMERVDGAAREPYTWVRTQGKGRVLYTAYGHDQRTWGNPGFHRLIDNAIRWVVDDTARECWEALKMAPLSYVEGFNVPNYENRTPAPEYQLPLTPEESMRFIQTPADFTLELFASEPDIVKPISFSFDERGRLWLLETVDYPNKILDGQPGDDRIRILEDTDGDGRADKFTVFAEHLNIPTSLTFANGGVIVSQAPHVLFLKDTDGDDKADVRRVLNTGWGTRDTHAGPSNLMYGPDNQIWGVVGYSGFDAEIAGKRIQFIQGVFRFKPDGSTFEVMTNSTNNTWGLGFSETFDVFGSTANNDPSFYMAIPNRYFEGIEGLPTSTTGARASGPGYQSAAQFYRAHHLTPYIRQVDVHGGYTAAAGHHLYTARAFPQEYWNRIAFITEPTAHLVGQGIVEKQGAGFVTRDGWNLMAGADEWVAPVHAQVGPDGAVWVSDWYNFITQHNPTPPGYSNGRGNAYETSLRDRQRGRIYRIAYKRAPAWKPRSLSIEDPAGLVAALGADNMFWRMHGQRLLVERGQRDVVPQLLALVRDTSVDAIRTNGGAFHALWTLHGLGELQTVTSEAGRAALDALKHPAAGVRKAAAMVLPRTPQAASAIVSAGLLADPDLHTRLAAALVIADMPASPEIGRAVYAESRKAENYEDRWLSRAFYIAATRHRDSFLTTYRGDPSALPVRELPVALRIGTLKPDWRMPAAADAAAWRDMDVPGNWESRGLPDFDGVVWFSRTVNVAAAAAGELSLGRISNFAEVWVNGMSVSLPAGGRSGGPPNAGQRGGGRGNMPPTYALPQGTLRTGENTLTVRIQNNRNDGGFLGTPDAMFLEVGSTRLPLAGPWKFRVERQTNAGALYSRPGELAAHVAYVAGGGRDSGEALPPVAAPAPDVVIRLGVIPGQLKFDQNELTVGAGQLVELVFTNTDEMQHNFLLGAPGSLESIGAAADRLSATPDGLARQYVPDMAQVLASTRLVNPGETVTVQFRAPAEPGQYPYVCTFPAHWRIMNGILNVIVRQGRGGRGGA
ncbi:MAG TPA: PVC-type heme-binding CxxCH protein [Vicinamibacterales bacterium]|nr:PVC-type heme-binding CxxCH protein [Vicinamibacterales bacterium]